MAQERAKQLLKVPEGKGIHCCQFVAYCIYGDKSKNQGGANGWQNWGQQAKQDDARVIWQNGHVGFVASGKVYYSSGNGGTHKVKSLSDYKQWVVKNNAYKYRK